MSSLKIFATASAAVTLSIGAAYAADLGGPPLCPPGTAPIASGQCGPQGYCTPGGAGQCGPLGYCGPGGAAAAPGQCAPLGPPVYEASGWYLRGYIGMTNQSVKSLELEPLPAAFAGETITTPFLSFDSSPLFGFGAGYQINNWLRLDATGEYRANAHFHGQQVESAGGVTLPDDYTASKSEWLFLANAYVDLGTWWHVTPFVGGGIGTSLNTISNFMDTGATQSGATILSTTYFANNSQWNLAWALYAGLSYQVTPSFSVDLTYRYVNLGNAQTGTPRAFDGTPIPTSPFVFKDITSSDLMLGMRWMLWEPPPPLVPLVRKG
jgi:opacity protein-like surface antigen